MQNLKVSNWPEVTHSARESSIQEQLAAIAQPVICVQTPAKLIISGEHSVLYKQPALAVAINNYTTCKVSLNSAAEFRFELLDLGYQHTHTSKSLLNLAQKLRHAYKAFLAGNCSIRNVIQEPQELIEYTLSYVLENLPLNLQENLMVNLPAGLNLPASLNLPAGLNLPIGLNLQLNSSIPIGCGMGSSAAAVVSTIYALSNLFAENISKVKVLSLAQQIENLQHGKSSGLDLHLVANGGCVFFDNGLMQKRALDALPMYIVHTGPPQSTTGECVSSVVKHFANSALDQQFGQVTRAIDLAITQNDVTNLQLGIKQNHRLLQQIGVVPDKVAQFIAEVEANGAAAKICGAGAVFGDNAGAVLLVGNGDFTQLAAKYAYSLETIAVDHYGTKII